MKRFRTIVFVIRKYLLPITTFVGGVLATYVTVTTLFFPEPDELVVLKNDIVAGLQKLDEEPLVNDPERQLVIINGLRVKLLSGPLAGLRQEIADRKQIAASAIEQRRAIELEAEQNGKRIEEERQALLEMQPIAQSEEQKRIAIELEDKALAALEVAKERQRQLAEQAAAEEMARRQAEANRIANEARNAAALREANQLLQAERFCRDANCTDWILR